MADIPEIERLRAAKGGAGESWNVDAVALEDAERELRSALDRQAREIVEDARAEAAGDVSPPIAYALRWFASRVEQRFAPKEADPPYSHPECCNPTCPHPDLCEPGCIDRQADAKEADPR